jgi:tetratricopeptide (TPR) repeat protein
MFGIDIANLKYLKRGANVKRWMLYTCLALLTQGALADEALDSELASLQHAWAKATYQTPKDQQEPAFKALTEQAHQLSAKNPEANEAMIWEAITLSGYAKSMGPLHPVNALKAAEQARDLLLASIKTNPQALNGSAYTTLGSLYFRVPGWPIGFGDKKKGREYLEKALQLNPTGIDSNYFYADYLRAQGEYSQAVTYYQKALQAPARAGREDADAGRKQEVEEGLRLAQSKLK